MAGAIRGYARDAARAFQQAPLEVALGILTAVTFSIAMRRDSEEAWTRVGGAAAQALPLLLALSVLRARRVIDASVRWGASAAVLLAAAAYGAWVIDPDHGSEGWRFIALLGAGVMTVSLIGAIGEPSRERRRLAVWRFDARLLIRIVTVVAYGGALFAALAGAVAAVSQLFDLRTPEHLYTDLMGAVFFALVPWVIVGGIDELIAPPPAEERERAPRLVRLLGRYLYAPVLAVYLAILLAYAVKVLITGEAPKNLLSPIILLAGLFGFLGSVLLEPLRGDPEHGGVERMIRVLPLPMLALLPFGLWAVWVRRDQYGWTEFRYLRFALLVALAVLAVLGTVRLLRRREPLLLLVPLVLGATLLVSAVGPWGAVALSRRSQQARLRAGLEQASLLRNGKVSRSLTPRSQTPGDTLTLPADSYERIAGSLRYLYDEHGPDAVQPLFAQEVAGYGNGFELLNALRLHGGCRAEQRLSYASATLREETPIPGLPAGTLYRLHANRDGARQDTLGARLVFDDSVARVTIPRSEGPWTAAADLRPIYAQLTGQGGAGCSIEGVSMNVMLTAAEARRPLVDATGTVRGELILTQVSAGERGGEPTGAAPLHLDRIDALVVVVGR